MELAVLVIGGAAMVDRRRTNMSGDPLNFAGIFTFCE
jgi:hypothetical protein